MKLSKVQGPRLQFWNTRWVRLQVRNVWGWIKGRFLHFPKYGSELKVFKRSWTGFAILKKPPLKLTSSLCRIWIPTARLDSDGSDSHHDRRDCHGKNEHDGGDWQWRRRCWCRWSSIPTTRMSTATGDREAVSQWRRRRRRLKLGSWDKEERIGAQARRSSQRLGKTS